MCSMSVSFKINTFTLFLSTLLCICTEKSQRRKLTYRGISCIRKVSRFYEQLWCAFVRHLSGLLYKDTECKGTFSLYMNSIRSIILRFVPQSEIGIWNIFTYWKIFIFSIMFFCLNKYACKWLFEVPSKREDFGILKSL